MHSIMADATSWTVTRRPIGCMFSRICRASASDRPVPAEIAATDSSVIGVSTYPGQTAFTVTPVRATSEAAVRTRPRTPCLLAVYAAIRAEPTFPATDATTTTRPDPAAVIAGSARRRQRNGAVRLRSSIRCQSSSVVLTSGADIDAPALTTRISTAPHSCSTRANAASIAIGSSMSAGTTSASPGSDSATAPSAVSSRETSATRWPASDRACAHAAPIPFDAPVTRAMLMRGPREIGSAASDFVGCSSEGRDAGEVGPDGEQVHLLGALVVHHRLEVVHVPHHRVVQRDPGAAERRTGLTGHVERGAHVGVLAVGDLDRGERAGVLERAEPPRDQRGVVDRDGHQGELALGELERRQRIADLQAHPDEGKRPLEGRASRADDSPDDAEARLVQARERPLEAAHLG